MQLGFSVKNPCMKSPVALFAAGNGIHLNQLAGTWVDTAFFSIAFIKFLNSFGFP